MRPHYEAALGRPLRRAAPRRAAPRRRRFSHWRQAFLTGVAARRGFPGGGGAKGIRRRAGFLRTT